MKFLKDKIAVVTGGTRGIGRAIVLMLAQNGCNVAFSYRKNADLAKDLKKEVEKCGVKCKINAVDVRDYEKVKAWIEEVKKELQGLDILVNNAGILIDKALMMMTPEDWYSVIDTNLNGVFHATRCCVVTFLKQKSGRIVNISSVSGNVGAPRQTNYSATKGGINAFTKALAKEVANYGVLVNAVAPGYIETDMLSELTDEQRNKIQEMIPLGRVGKPEDVANAVKFLLSEQAQYMTGQIITVDGGLAMR